MTPDDGRPPFDEDKARELMGSLVLVGITNLHPDGEFDNQEQFFGRVVKTDVRQGICLLLEGARAGEYYWLPPATDFFDRADPGEYRLRSTGETVVDPDFISTWTRTAPASQ